MITQYEYRLSALASVGLGWYNGERDTFIWLYPDEEVPLGAVPTGNTRQVKAGS